MYHFIQIGRIMGITETESLSTVPILEKYLILIGTPDIC